MILIQLRTSRHYAETWPKAPVGCQTGDAQIGVCVQKENIDDSSLIRTFARLNQCGSKSARISDQARER